MIDSHIDKIRGFKLAGLAVLFLVVGGLIGGSAYVAFLPAQLRVILRVAMPIITLVIWLILVRSDQSQEYRELAAAFFAVSLGLLIAHFIGNLPLQYLNLSPATIKGMAVAKFSDTLPIILSILILHFSLGGKAEGLFLKPGGTKVGLVSSIVGVAIMLAIAALQALGLGLDWARLSSALPWILVFVFSNAFLEELWFRGLFLKKLEPLTGQLAAILLTSLVFGFVHISSTYVIDILKFVGVTFGLGVLWSWLMYKSNSIWPAVLIHAAADVLVMIGFLAA